MLAKEIKGTYPLIWKCLDEIVRADDTGRVNESAEMPKKYKNIPIKGFLRRFNNWLKKLDGKKVSDVIEVQDFMDYLGWGSEAWDSFAEEWYEYHKDGALESFATSEDFMMTVIARKYDGRIFHAFLTDCFNGIVPVFLPTMYKV